MTKLFGTFRSLFSRVYLIEHEDSSLTKETWLQVQPVYQFEAFTKSWVITQPSSTFWVYLLGIIGCFLGGWFWQTAEGDIARELWSLGCWLWGIGALLAGTSYQAFGYHLKCVDGRVRWTNWFEVIYMVCQQWSINALFAATAYTSTEGAVRYSLIAVSVTLTCVYGLLIIIGAFKPNRKLLSFEWMCIVSLPFVLVMMFVHFWQIIRLHSLLDLWLCLVWVGLLLCMAAYWLYWKTGLTQKLWAKGRWFSENDVLHVTLILWFGLIAFVSPFVKVLN